MSGGKVLITEATGFRGSAILMDLLESGYTAHIVVRNDVEGALDQATAGTDFVIHWAKPLPYEELDSIVMPTIGFTGNTPNENIDPSYADPMVAYCAANTAADRCFVKWMEKAVEQGVSFEFISLASS
ncbi:hypothetical protein N0V82_001599 [Gnomoniopsis sp. IMI 355080]|nr:hypothetical protein N0V82_001599 [Gnomoniopsis sp. IMI 355080]